MSSRHIAKYSKFLFLPLVLVALSACGQKGELYLPEEGTAELDRSTRLS